MFGWLFRRPLRRDEVIRIATDFAVAEWKRHTADWPDEQRFDNRYVLGGVSLGVKYWFIEFSRLHPVGLISTSDHGFDIWVHKLTGEVDHGDVICQREREKHSDT
jgi:hypothetical protein